jgi:hypothetical protein
VRKEGNKIGIWRITRLRATGKAIKQPCYNLADRPMADRPGRRVVQGKDSKGKGIMATEVLTDKKRF